MGPNSIIWAIYVVCLVVVVLFGIVFIAISALYINAKKKLYSNKLEDPKVQIDVDKYYEKVVKDKKDGEDVYASAERRSKRAKTWTTVWNSFLILIYVLVLVVLGIGAVNKAQGRLNFFGNVAPLVIETDSMETANDLNTYLAQNNLQGKENRIEQFAYITISKDPNVINNISQYDIVAFYMPVRQSDGTDKDIVMVHRLITIGQNDKGETVYTFRGDAYAQSNDNEKEVTKDKIIGVYQSKDFKGSYSLGFGYFVVYIQSSVGIITIVISILLLIIYCMIFESLEKAYNLRFLALFKEKLDGVVDEKTLLAQSVAAKDANSYVAVAPSLGGSSAISRTTFFERLFRFDKDKLIPGFCLTDNKATHVLVLQDSIYDGQHEYSYSGKIESGDVQFNIVKLIDIPANEIPNHGFTFEGIADQIFKVENALRCWHDEQGRSFVYVKEDSKLTFVGDKDKKYNIYVRLFDNEFNIENNRWIVIYAEEDHS